MTPLSWTVPARQSVHQMCACKYTTAPPYCDGTHTNLPARVLQRQRLCDGRRPAGHHPGPPLCTRCGWVTDF
ncbi:hypothetical protein NP493_64g06083 [Ridgeia piscesae]|uniref:Iron-binding zinc finger CDGSH type n=1 Tax=Ridgeia piscesae TaxID=27915 RepID=A0AAD9UIV9_RIDPI|nr:hypothetical protein NP493_64g06083 [Ridgeia piscesae]